jgi:hypothetical protein
VRTRPDPPGAETSSRPPGAGLQGTDALVFSPGALPPAGVEISCRIYGPRESPLFRLVERHLEDLLCVWPARFARQHWPLRPVVERVLREFLKCGLLEHGFARIWCGKCRRIDSFR